MAPDTNTHSALARKIVRRGFRFALIGLVFGFVGLGTAVYRMALEAEPPPPRSEAKVISEVLADTIKKTTDKWRHRQTTPAASSEPVDEWPMTKKLGVAASICGLIGTVFGCVSWLVHEYRRYTWAALCVGLVALAWTHVVFAIAVAVGLWVWHRLNLHFH